MKEGGGQGRKVSFLSSPPPPCLLEPFFARPLLRNSTETLVSQAMDGGIIIVSMIQVFITTQLVHQTCAISIEVMEKLL